MPMMASSNTWVDHHALAPYSERLPTAASVSLKNALLLGGGALDAEPGDTSGEVGAVDAIAVVDQVLGVVARGVASIIWRQTQAALGWAVTSTWSRRRRSWLIRRKTYRVWKVRV